MNAMTLSQDRRQQSPAGEPVGRAEERLAPRSVLVVEDDESSQDFYQQLFDVVYPNEFHCVIVSSAEAALNALDGRAFDAVILDWKLPGVVDGLTLLKHFRSEPGLEALPVIMVSARDAVADENSALDAGADAFMVKPAAPEQLILRLRLLTA